MPVGSGVNAGFSVVTAAGVCGGATGCVGTTTGAVDGSGARLAVGAADGSGAGLAVGVPDGSGVGLAVGAADGSGVGLTVGAGVFALTLSYTSFFVLGDTG